MTGFTRAILPMAVLCAIHTPLANAATEAERIALLEAQLKQQQEIMAQQQSMLQSMQTELAQLKDGAPAAASTTPVPAQQPVPGAAVAVTPPPAATGSTLPTPTAKSSALSVDVYGFAQADAVYDFKRVDPDWEDTLRVSTIPTQGGAYGNDGDFVYSVRQSRLGIKGNYGEDVTFKLEGELFGVGGDEGQTTLRVRHAYGTYKDFLMGQTWSNFMDPDIFPNTIDYWGPTGMVFYRNQQARYSFPMGGDIFSISLEDPSTALSVGEFRDTPNCELPDTQPDCESTDSTAEEVFQSYNDLPDLTARYRGNGDFGHYQVAGIVRKLGYERLDNGSKDYEMGWGINTSTGLYTWGKDQLKLQVAYGEGIGNYMNDGGLDIAPDSVDITQTGAEAVPTWGLSAYYDVYWSEQWSSSIGWSMTDLDTSDGQAGTEFKQGQNAQVNLLYYPMEPVMLGSEFIWGQREDVDGNTGSDYRIQFSMRVSFDSGDLLRR